jgi:hypothetical protein
MDAPSALLSEFRSRVIGGSSLPARGCERAQAVEGGRKEEEEEGVRLWDWVC